MIATAPPPQSAPLDDDMRLLMAIDRAATILSAQRALLASRDRRLPPSQSDAELVELASTLSRRTDAAHADGLRALSLSLDEIARRQESIRELMCDASAFESIALDAFSGAMHRIRTCLDISINNVEDISDICRTSNSLPQVVVNASEAARALRLVYHYTHELNEMAALQKAAHKINLSRFDCRDLLDEVVQSLSRMAAEAGVRATLAQSAEALACRTDRELLRRSLRHLFVMAIVSPGVTTVSCFVRRFKHSTGSMTAIYLTDNGKGLSLADRADLSAEPGEHSRDNGQAADLAGFAVARRLARGLGGLLTLEYLPGRGSRSQLTFPSDYPASAVRGESTR